MKSPMTMKGRVECDDPGGQKMPADRNVVPDGSEFVELETQSQPRKEHDVNLNEPPMVVL